MPDYQEAAKAIEDTDITILRVLALNAQIKRQVIDDQIAFLYELIALRKRVLYRKAGGLAVEGNKAY
jgi:hypothetical protein